MTPCSSALAQALPAEPTFPPATPRTCLTPLRCSAPWKARSSRFWAAAWWSTAGGNTAIDVARTAKRLGAEPLVVYRRTRERAPAHQFEIEEAIEEGVHMKWLSTIAHADEGEIRIEKMKLDESGRPVPTGEFETVSADSVVLALGQETNLKFLEGIDDLQMENGSVVVDGSMMTAVPASSPGGDMVPASAT